MEITENNRKKTVPRRSSLAEGLKPSLPSQDKSDLSLSWHKIDCDPSLENGNYDEVLGNAMTVFDCEENPGCRGALWRGV